jgi:NTE family protein
MNLHEYINRHVFLINQMRCVLLAVMKNTALVLGSGGARGLAQIGAIEVLEERGYNITSIAGCSMGAVIGGIYAAGHLADFKKWICNLDKFGVYNLMDFTLTSQGFIKGDRVFKEIKKFVSKTSIQDLEIPFKAVAVDIHNQKEVVFDEGDLFQAIRASVSIPSVLTPVIKDDVELVDGGVMNPLPLNLVDKGRHDLVLAIDLNGKAPYKPKNKVTKKRQEELDKERNKWIKAINDVFSDFFGNNKKHKRHNYFELINLSFTLMQHKLTEVIISKHEPDVLVSIPKAAADTFEFFRAEELIAYGREKTINALDEYEKKNKQ